MTVADIYFVSRETAENLLFFPDTAAISITDPGKRQARLGLGYRKILRLSFYDAVPGDEYIPIALPGCFDPPTARQIVDFVSEIHTATEALHLIVHCEQGLSRSAAVALFAAALTGAPVHERHKAGQANPWVMDLLAQQVPGLEIGFAPCPAPY